MILSFQRFRRVRESPERSTLRFTASSSRKCSSEYEAQQSKQLNCGKAEKTELTTVHANELRQSREPERAMMIKHRSKNRTDLDQGKKNELVDSRETRLAPIASRRARLWVDSANSLQAWNMSQSKRGTTARRSEDGALLGRPGRQLASMGHVLKHTQVLL